MTIEAGHRSPRRRARALLAILGSAVLATSGCRPSPDETTLYLADYVQFASSGVDADLVFPRQQGASRFLLRNWPPMGTLASNTLWVHGHWARIGFFSIVDQPPTFIAEARPYSYEGTPPQVLSVSLNGTRIESMAMRAGWHIYELPLPPELVNIGWNEIDLGFAESLRPADFDPLSNDRRTLAAEFRRIELRAASGRPFWPERPEEITLAAIGQPPGSASRAATSERTAMAGESTGGGAADRGDASPAGPPDSIEMPADSYLQIYLVPGREAQLLGEVVAGFAASGGDGLLSAVVEVLEPDRVTEVWTRELRPAASESEVSADLSPWAGRVVALRLRVFGRTNGIVSWKRLATTGSIAPGESLVGPDAIVAPPRTGVLGRPDVFVIILDAARADRFEGELGAELAPNVQALGAAGTWFGRAWAPSAWTGQSIPSILTGLTPDTAGMENWGSQLPGWIATFPELIGEAGYHTVLWSQHNIYSLSPELRRGFEVFEEVPSADLAARELLPAIAAIVDDERPTLALIHLMAPHEPYLPPAPFSGSRSGWYRGEDITVTLLDEFDLRYPEEQAQQRDEIRRAAFAMYEENVQFADHLVGRLIDDLRREGRYDDALIIVTADHGEAFHEHDRFLHTTRVYEEFLRVPLAIKWPRSFEAFESRVDAPVSLVDLAPTLVDGLAITDERARYQGYSLLSPATGRPAPERVLYAYTSGEPDPARDPKPQYALLWNDLKLVQDERYGQTDLFRLSSDPGESADISLREGFYAAWLKQTLRLAQQRNASMLLRFGGARVEALDPETIRMLRALGYLR